MVNSTALEIVHDMLGDNADGIYIAEAEVEYGDSECSLYSTEPLSSSGCCYIESVKGIQVKRGVSKVVFIPKDTDYVIKMSITHMYDENGNVVRTNSRDILEEEMEFYNNASSLLKKVLGKIEVIGEYNGMKVYIQEKADKIFYDMYIEELEEDKQHFENFCKSYHIIDMPDVIGEHFAWHMTKFFSMEEIQKVNEELWEMNCDDLHMLNLGLRKDGSPFIFDYGGYDSYTHWNYLN